MQIVNDEVSLHTCVAVYVGHFSPPLSQMASVKFKLSYASLYMHTVYANMYTDPNIVVVSL